MLARAATKLPAGSCVAADGAAIPFRDGSFDCATLVSAFHLFEDKLGAYYPDAQHEDRFILIGYSRRHRLLYVVHAEVQQDVIRIISARRATSHEKAHYEND